MTSGRPGGRLPCGRGASARPGADLVARAAIAPARPIYRKASRAGRRRERPQPPPSLPPDRRQNRPLSRGHAPRALLRRGDLRSCWRRPPGAPERVYVDPLWITVFELRARIEACAHRWRRAPQCVGDQGIAYCRRLLRRGCRSRVRRRLGTLRSRDRQVGPPSAARANARWMPRRTRSTIRSTRRAILQEVGGSGQIAWPMETSTLPNGRSLSRPVSATGQIATPAWRAKWATPFLSGRSLRPRE